MGENGENAYLNWQQMKNNKYISTSDFNLASYLIARNCKVEYLDRSNPKRVQFVFVEVPQIFINDFWANKSVNVIDFMEAQQMLKRRLFSDSF